MTRINSSYLALLAILLPSLAANADPVGLIFETDANAGAGDELAIGTYASIEDLIASNAMSIEFSDIDIAGSFSTTGIAFDGDLFHLLFETDVNAGAGDELAIGTYASIEDLIASNAMSIEFSDIDIAGSFSTTGFAFDGDLYYLLFETDANAGAGDELAIGTYASIEDLIASNAMSIEFSDIDIAGNFSTTGIAFDGDLFHLLFETDANAGAGDELAIGTYASIEDLIASNAISIEFSDIDIAGNFSTTGLYSTFDVGDDISVPEPGTLTLLGIGLLGMGAARRR